MRLLQITIIAIALLASTATAAPADASAEATPAAMAVNAKGWQTYLVERQLPDQFHRVKVCLPVQLTVVSSASQGPASGTSAIPPPPADVAVITVNTTDRQASSNIQTVVKNQELVRGSEKHVLWLRPIAKGPAVHIAYRCLTNLRGWNVKTPWRVASCTCVQGRLAS